MFKGRPEDIEQSYACKIETTHILLMRYFHQEMYTYFISVLFVDIGLRWKETKG